MLRHTLLLIFAFLLPAQVSSGGNCLPVASVSRNNLAFEAGEKLSYVMHYRFGILNSDIGKATIALENVNIGGLESFHCHITGRTSRFYDCFFRVREDFNSWFTSDGLFPVRFTRDTHEGKYEARNDYSYFWNEREPYIDATVFTSSRGDEVMKIPLETCTADLPALFFRARNIDMERVVKDRKYPLTFSIDGEVIDMHFIYRGRETVTVKGLGKVRCMRFSAQLFEGNIFNGDAYLNIYISDDSNRIPVLFGAPIRVGEVEGRLESYEGLKYPFSSMDEQTD